MDGGRQEGQSAGHDPSMQKKKPDDSAEQCLPSTSKDLNQERKQSQSGMKIGQMNCSIGKVHRILKDKNLMFPIYLRLLTDTQTLIDQTMMHYREADLLINIMGLELYRSSYLENLVRTSSLSTLQSNPIVWAAYMRGREDLCGVTCNIPTSEPQSVLADMPSMSNIRRLRQVTTSNQEIFDQVDMLKKLKEHFQVYHLLKRKERKLLRAAQHGLTLMNSENDN